MKPTVLIFRIGSLGDTIVALPCFHAIRRAYPNHRILLLTNVPVARNAAPLMAVLGSDNQFADGVIEYPISLRSPNAILALARQIRAENVHEAVYLMPQRSRANVWRDWAFLRFAAGIERVRALPFSEDFRLPRVDPTTGEIEREAARLTRCCADLGPIDLWDRSFWDLQLTDEERARASHITAPLGGFPFFALNMGGKAREKDWGMANWRALSALLQQDYPWGAMVVGAREDEGRAEDFLANWRSGPVVNACGRLSPRESGAAMAGANLFIGHDSGPLHLASVVGTPSIGLFGDYNQPCLWHPMGSHVRVIHEMAGLSHISPDQVMTQVRELFSTLEGQDG